MTTLRLAVLLVCATLSPLLNAEPATARYAPAQLQVAERELARAHAAFERGEHALAEQLATQAALDARLAWSMSDSPSVREDAGDVLRRATELRRSPGID